MEGSPAIKIVHDREIFFALNVIATQEMLESTVVNKNTSTPKQHKVLLTSAFAMIADVGLEEKEEQQK